MSKYKISNDNTKNGQKNTKEKSKDCNGSSVREQKKETIAIDDEPEVQLEVYGKISQKIASAYVLIAPNATKSFQEIQSKLQSLKNAGSSIKDQAIKFMQFNLRYHNIENINNLLAINDDQFWYVSMPSLIKILILCLPKLQHIRLLMANSQQMIDLTREDVLVLLASMFLGIMPKQPHQQCVTFGDLMVFREDQSSKVLFRRQKLKCILAYFKVMMKNTKNHYENIRIKRTSNLNKSYLDISNYDHEVPLRMVTLEHASQKSMNDYYGRGILIDFSSKRLGGRVLRNGCKQEEILFLTYPELIVTRLLCEKLENDEAVIVYGARCFSKHRMQNNEFTFTKEYPFQKGSLVSKSVIVAIDAADFTAGSLTNIQYSKKAVQREINKAYAGFQGATFEGDEDLPIVTGRWDCESLNGDEDLKFLIQWIAASEANREMIYIADNIRKIEEYRMLTRELSMLTTLDLLTLLDEFSHLRLKSNYENLRLFQYLKYVS